MVSDKVGGAQENLARAFRLGLRESDVRCTHTNKRGSSAPGGFIHGSALCLPLERKPSLSPNLVLPRRARTRKGSSPASPGSSQSLSYHFSLSPFFISVSSHLFCLPSLSLPGFVPWTQTPGRRSAQGCRQPWSGLTPQPRRRSRSPRRHRLHRLRPQETTRVILDLPSRCSSRSSSAWSRRGYGSPTTSCGGTSGSAVLWRAGTSGRRMRAWATG
jgi:hypothetical protein